MSTIEIENFNLAWDELFNTLLMGAIMSELSSPVQNEIVSFRLATVRELNILS